ncbi:MAG: hypothetical protein IEMM0008_0513 [bacterium]|nr:MAG: hypothetical protein IEMM0008_0513 [bacterium]
MAIFARKKADKERVQKDINDVINKLKNLNYNVINKLKNLDLRDKDRVKSMKDRVKYRVEDYLGSIRPKILKYYGEKLLANFESLVRSYSFDAAIKLLEVVPQRRPLQKNEVRKVLTHLFLFLGVTLLIVGYYQLIYTKESINWPSTDGVIISSKVTTYTYTRSIRTTYDVDVHYYDADVHYKYTINGKEYTNDKKAFSGSSGGSGEEAHAIAIAIVKRYPRGKNVKVYYKPDDPGTAVLEPSGWEDYLWLLVVAASLLIPSLRKFYSFFVRGKV